PFDNTKAQRNMFSRRFAAPPTEERRTAEMDGQKRFAFPKTGDWRGFASKPSPFLYGKSNFFANPAIFAVRFCHADV
ncbi:MAG: hypothetical protein RSA67_06430, partial [Alistipes sp.]